MEEMQPNLSAKFGDCTKHFRLKCAGRFAWYIQKWTGEQHTIFVESEQQKLHLNWAF